MGSDMMVAQGAATVSGNTLIAVNHFGTAERTGSLRYLPAREHAPGEIVSHPSVELVEARQTLGVLGMQPVGAWGLTHGCNDHRLAVGMACWKSRLPSSPCGLDGPDLVRLSLERGQSARNALEILAELIEKHGQTGTMGDHVFLLADPRESFVLEAAGNHWSTFECHQTRAVCDVGLVHQDWQRLSRGLAELVIEQSWWPNDGTKVNFHAALADPDKDTRFGLRRWGRATLALAQQEGAIDPYCMRRLMQEHFDLCFDLVPPSSAWRGSSVVQLSPDAPPIVWIAPSHLGCVLFFPLVVGVPLPQVWHEGLPVPSRRFLDKESTELQLQDRLQAQFDQELEAFLQAAVGAAPSEVRRLAQAMMTNHSDLWSQECRGHSPHPTTAPHRSHQEQLHAFISE